MANDIIQVDLTQILTVIEDAPLVLVVTEGALRGPAGATGDVSALTARVAVLEARLGLIAMLTAPHGVGHMTAALTVTPPPIVAVPLAMASVGAATTTMALTVTAAAGVSRIAGVENPGTISGWNATNIAKSFQPTVPLHVTDVAVQVYGDRESMGAGPMTADIGILDSSLTFLGKFHIAGHAMIGPEWVQGTLDVPVDLVPGTTYWLAVDGSVGWQMGIVPSSGGGYVDDNINLLGAYRFTPGFGATFSDPSTIAFRLFG